MSKIPKAHHNRILNMFSNRRDVVEYGFKEHMKEQETTPEIYVELLEAYHLEGLIMSYTTEDFVKEVRQRVASEMTIQERLAGIPKEEVLKNYSLQDLEAYLKKARSQKTK